MADILKLSTPKGKFIYPHLNNPDTKFNADGLFHVKLSLSSEASENLIKKLEGEATNSFNKFKESSGKSLSKADYPWKLEEDTGNYIFNFKLNHKAKSRKTGNEWEQKPIVYDSELKPFDMKINIWGGTQGKISFEVNPWNVSGKAGISLRLKAVQIIDLVEGSSGDGSQFGFTQEEGYVMTNDSIETNEDVNDQDDF